MAASLGIEQPVLSSKLGFMSSLISEGPENGFSISQASPNRKPSLSARRSSSSLSSSKSNNLRLGGNRLMSMHFSPSCGSSTNTGSQSTHRMSTDIAKRAVSSIVTGGVVRIRRSIDDNHLIRRASSSQQLSYEGSAFALNSAHPPTGGELPTSNGQNGLAGAAPLRRAASAQNILCSRNGNASNGHHGSVQRKSSANAAMAYNAELLATFESEKKQLESRISELTQLTEKRKSEIERYKIELRQLTENLADHMKIQEENESVRTENKLLREKLREISGGAFEQLTDTEKLSLLQQSAVNGTATSSVSAPDAAQSGSGGSECGRTVHTPEHGSCFSVDVRGNLCGGGHSVISGDTWDRHSCKSGAESDAPSAGISSFVIGQAGTGSGTNGVPATDVANLRDKIAMMEETNYSTNEELQATVQELVEMQKTVNELQEENERLADERAVLLASLCAQTQKLENCRVQIEHLKALLLSDGDSGDRSEYEQQLTELVKRGEEERDELLLRQAELSNALTASEYDVRELFDANSQLRDRLADTQAKIMQLETEKRQFGDKITSLMEELQLKAAELDRYRALLDTEQKSSTAGNEQTGDNHASKTNPPISSEAESTNSADLLRSEKTRIELRLADVEERLVISNRELARVRDQLASAQAATAELDSRLSVVVRERTSFEQELLASQQQLDQLARAAESSQSDLAAMRIRLDGALRRASDIEGELNDTRRRHTEDSEEWRQFQRDLQMAVVVANNMCVETKENLDRLSEENEQLREQHRQISQERARLVEENTRLRSSISRIEQQSSAERELAAAATMQRFRAATSTSATSSTAASNQQLSVKSLIRSIEAQVKTGGPAASNNAAAAAAVAAAALLSSHHHHQVNSITGSPRRSMDPVSLGSHGGSPSGTASPVSVLSVSRASPATHTTSVNSADMTTPTSASNASNNRPSLRKTSSVSLTSEASTVSAAASSITGGSTSSLKPPRPLSSASSAGASSINVTPIAIGPSPSTLPPLPSSVVTTPPTVTGGDSHGTAAVTDASSTPSASCPTASTSATRLTSRITMCDLAKDPLTLLAKQLGGSKRNALLKWCQSRTQGYSRIEVTNFSSSWADGLAFCALLHSYLPDSVPYNQLVAETEGGGTINERRRNFTVAFQAAESVGISHLLDIDEMLATERPDWQRIMAYVTAIYKCFELPDLVALQTPQNGAS